MLFRPVLTLTLCYPKPNPNPKPILSYGKGFKSGFRVEDRVRAGAHYLVRVRVWVASGQRGLVLQSGLGLG